MKLRSLLSGLVALALALVGAPRHVCACGVEALVAATVERAPSHACCGAAKSGDVAVQHAPCGCDTAAADPPGGPGPEPVSVAPGAPAQVWAVLPIPRVLAARSGAPLRVRAHGARGPPRTGPPIFLVQRSLLV